MPGPRADPSLNHPLTMSYMGAGSGGEKGWGAGIFTLPCQGGSRPAGARGGVDGEAGLIPTYHRESVARCPSLAWACRLHAPSA
jgi:hypothetical protein